MDPKTVKKALKDAIQAMTDYKWALLRKIRQRQFQEQEVSLSKSYSLHPGL